MSDIPIFITILDITLTSILLYLIYYLFRRTHTATIVKGLLIAMIIYILSSVMRLQTLNWIFVRFFNDFPIIVAILFQQEIRHFFSNIGRNYQAQQKSKNFSYHLAQALSDLSKNKTGALIIIEENMKLNDLLLSGIILNSHFSTHLLQTIFYSGTPLHDGAVIIRNEQIIAAHVFIPTASSSNTIGTRHNAGTFITSERDCIAFIVSEETGSISYAKNGTLISIPNHLVKESVNEILR